MVIFLIGISISVFLCLLLLIKQHKSSSDRILAVWLGVLAIHQLLAYFSDAGLFFRYPHLLGITLPLPLLHGVFLYFYVYDITQEKPIALRPALPHFIPFVLLASLAIPFYTLPAADKVRVFASGGQGFEWYNLTQVVLIVVLGLGYAAWSLVLIYRHRSNMERLFSNKARKTLQWLEYLSIGLGAIWLLTAFFDDWVIFSGVVVLVLFIGVFGINQLTIFYPHLTLEQEGTATADINPPQEETKLSGDGVRYAKSGLKTGEAGHIYHRLQVLMDQKALYKNSDLSLTELARELGVHPNYLSQAINENVQMNFYHYINTLRVQEFIRIAAAPASKHFTLLALAYDCGFNSKSTFNKYFKRHTGQTPSDFFGSQIID